MGLILAWARAVRKKVIKLYNPDMRTVNSAVQTMPLKRRSADEINLAGSEERLAIGRRTARKKKNPPINRTTEPTCIHCINAFSNIFLGLSAVGTVYFVNLSAFSKGFTLMNGYQQSAVKSLQVV